MTQSKRAWTRPSSGKPLDAKRGLESIVRTYKRTSQYAEDLDSTPMEGQGWRGNRWVGRGGVQGRYKADSRHTWAAGRNTSMSKACAIVVTCTYIGEALLGTLRSPNEPGRGLRAVSLWTPNEASNLSYVPLSMPRTLMVCLWRTGAARKPVGRGAIISPFSPLFLLIPTISAPSGHSDNRPLIPLPSPLHFRSTSDPLVPFPVPYDLCFVLRTLSGVH